MEKLIYICLRWYFGDADTEATILELTKFKKKYRIFANPKKTDKDFLKLVFELRDKGVAEVLPKIIYKIKQ